MAAYSELVCVILDPCKSGLSGSTDSAANAVRREIHEVGATDDVRLLKEKIGACQNCTVSCAADEKGPWMLVKNDHSVVSFMVSKFKAAFLHIRCECTKDVATEDKSVACMKKQQSAFQVLMAAQTRRTLPPKKTQSQGVQTGLNRRDELYNDVLAYLGQQGVDFPNDVESEAVYNIKVLTSALWYLTNQHMTIKEAFDHRRISHPIPECFSTFQGYDEYKRKKVKEKPLGSSTLKGHSDALASLCLKPMMSGTKALDQLRNDIHSLANCCKSYSEYLIVQLREQSKRQKLDHPVRTVSSDCSVEHRDATTSVDYCYSPLDDVINETPFLTPVVFDEQIHITQPFVYSQQRLRFIEQMKLSVPIDVVKYCPGGSNTTIIVVYRTSGKRTQDQILTETSQVMLKLKCKLPEYHTRQMKRAFKEKFSPLLSKATPSLMEFIYQELSVDASSATNPVISGRIELILQGETGIFPDLRGLNSKKSGDYEIFFGKMQEVIEDSIAADDRRHNTCHLAEWLSIRDIINKTSERCPPNTAIPSKSLVRLQFTPRNPYAKTANAFASRFNVQHKIQRRQLRASHPDNHYCAAQLKYLKELAVRMRDVSSLFFVDDKAKLRYGEPGHVLSTGVRGKESLAPTTTTIVAEDHDTHHKGSLTPSVYLQCATPTDASSSFCRGNVSVFLNDTLFESASPFRHAAAVIELAKNTDSTVKPVLLKYSDGGTDQRNTLEKVRCSLICIFKALNLDMLIACRCAPGQSWLNTAERVMSVLNIALQNCALERKRCSAETEKTLKRCTNMDMIRSKLTECNAIEEWHMCIEEIRAKLRSRFERMSLKQDPIKTKDPIKEAEIDKLHNMLLSMFPGIQLDQLTKKYMSALTVYQSWLKNHCRLTQYTFQIRKCEDETCCTPRQLPLETLIWLPEPVLSEDKDHFKKFADVYDTDTTDSDRPSRPLIKAASASAKTKKTATAGKKATAKNTSTAKRILVHQVTSSEESTDSQLLTSQSVTMDSQAYLFTAQNARYTATCVHCRKPRVIYSTNRLTDRQSVQVAVALSEYEYTCGSPLFPPNNSLVNKVHVRMNITCDDMIETPYYSAGIDRTDLCAYCGIEDCMRNADLLKTFKTVLPICEECSLAGKTAFCLRPYGKQN